LLLLGLLGLSGRLLRLYLPEMLLRLQLQLVLQLPPFRPCQPFGLGVCLSLIFRSPCDRFRSWLA
jgi:hypothetical protein